MKNPNRLIHETSPYLLQHAYNPVDWYPWSEEAFNKARQENKLLLISIGYSACHWCHVMEHEVFENDIAAEFMNEHFVNIKVDREERPDVDQIYMLAVQLMSQHGGWPLNCFVLPDGRPVYGGTYFPLRNWLDLLNRLVEIYRSDNRRLLEYADQLATGMKQLENFSPGSDIMFDPEFVGFLIKKWSEQWDLENGGQKRAPKFPMPNNYEFLLQYFNRNDSTYQNVVARGNEYVFLTLDKMALGGIFDQVGGGFSRYSVDERWKIPHFEKMLYDNAQLVSLYSIAYRQSGYMLYRDVVDQTIEFILRELKSGDGLFHAALDADSEGVEGKYYTWEKEELEAILGSEFDFAKEYFNINENGFWENNQYILLRSETDEKFASRHAVPLEKLKQRVREIRNQLMLSRSNRIRPGLDDKCITSWNALVIIAFCDAFKAFGNKTYYDEAILCSEKIIEKVYSAPALFHVYTKGKKAVNGFLEDYATLANAFLAVYEISFDEKWLLKADEFAQIAIEKFFDPHDGLFWFTEKSNSHLFTRNKEIEDNVIPSSNSVMAKLLFKLAIHFEKNSYRDIVERMIRTIVGRIEYGPGYSNWLQVYLWLSSKHFEVVFTGPEATRYAQEFHGLYVPNVLVAGSTKESSLPLLKKRVSTNPAIYVCTGRTCQLPVDTIEETLQLINSL